MDLKLHSPFHMRVLQQQTLRPAALGLTWPCPVLSCPVLSFLACFCSCSSINLWSVWWWQIGATKRRPYQCHLHVAGGQWTASTVKPTLATVAIGYLSQCAVRSQWLAISRALSWNECNKSVRCNFSNSKFHLSLSLSFCLESIYFISGKSSK